jgi:hypothetical protein
MSVHTSNSKMLAGGGKPWTRMDSILANKKKKRRKATAKKASAPLKKKGRGIFGRISDALK